MQILDNLFFLKIICFFYLKDLGINYSSIPPPLQETPQKPFFAIKDAQSKKITITKIEKGSPK